MTTSTSKWRLDGQKALITGGTKGIGLAAVEEFLALGAEVIVAARSSDTLNTCLARWRADNLPVHGIPADVSSESGRLSLADFVKKTWGSLDILVNNAGTNIRKATMEYSDEEITKIFETNLWSAYGLSRLLHPLLKESNAGCIVNVSSIAGINAMRSGSPYGMTKAAINQMTRNLAVEWAKDGIRVNAVAPGFTITPLTEFWQSNEAYMLELKTKTPLARMGDADEVAAAITFLAMPASSFTTGQCLVVDGGFTTNLV